MENVIALNCLTHLEDKHIAHLSRGYFACEVFFSPVKAVSKGFSEKDGYNNIWPRGLCAYFVVFVVNFLPLRAPRECTKGTKS